MLWSHIPVITFPIVAMAIAAKIPLEVSAALMILQTISLVLFQEKLIEEDDTLGSAYITYKENVPFRLIPYIW
jgi:protein-S-isoprenylcysteine O-methyltransferase Ste14